MTRLGTAMAEPVTSQSGEASPGGAVVGFEEPRSIPPVIIAGQRADWRPRRVRRTPLAVDAGKLISLRNSY